MNSFIYRYRDAMLLICTLSSMACLIFLFSSMIILSEHECFVSCPESDFAKHIPEDAKELKSLGNGWLEFTLDGNTYIYHRGTGPYKAREAIALIKSSRCQQDNPKDGK